uniref:Uncharacterized protein MANES_06G005500 n=1 Tax=Rhizophora mucronata TaxID=61149 RepID=A0A2P2MI62_RHIMU
MSLCDLWLLKPSRDKESMDSKEAISALRPSI